MSTYKVLQDIEAEDKFLGPLTLKQFIFAAIAFVCAYLSFFLLGKHAWFLVLPLLPVMIVCGFLAFPWGRDQPTEVWLLAKIRFFLKPKRRIWNQSGVQELVTITVPKKLEEFVTNNLSQTEVKSRLRALADTIDSRGWAVKNVNVNLFAQPTPMVTDQQSDRLIDMASIPKDVSTTDIQAADDILDEHNNPTAQHLDQMITASTKSHRKETLDHMQQVIQHQPTPQTKSGGPHQQDKEPPPDYWFMNQPPAGKTPPNYSTFAATSVLPGTNDDTSARQSGPLTADESALLGRLHSQANQPSAAYGHTKVIDPRGTHKPHTKKPHQEPINTPMQAVTQTPDPAILNLANNDDLTVATIAREANKKQREKPSDDEVVITLR